MDLLDDARGMQDDLQRLRRALHAEPEVGLDLPRTQERVLEELAGLPLEVSTGVNTTSVTAVLRGAGRPSDASPETHVDASTVLLRADMDALPVREATGLEYAARNGAMHGCGHDLHTTALVGAARLLSAHRDRLAGDVVFMFQPGEEGWGGARIMVDEGVLDASGRRAGAAYGLHVLSGTRPRGQFFAKPGIMLAASYRLSVEVLGAGGHGSSPHTAKDPVAPMAGMITALQTMVTRTFDVFDPVVITVGQVEAGSRHNIIPDSARFVATVRCYSPTTLEMLPAAISRTLEGVALSHGVEVVIDLEVEFPMTVNDEAEVAFGAAVVRDLMGEDRYETVRQPSAGSEDFSYVLNEVPGAFIMLGACPPGVDPQSAPMNHSSRARFDDTVLADAATIYAGLAVRRLDQATAPTPARKADR